MIDLHFHCLPGIDDGPRTWDAAVALCKEAAAQGTDTIVATPHVLRDPWLNEAAIERDELILHLNDLLGGTPRILPGCEYFFSSDAVELWEQGRVGPLTGLNRGTYLLVEFPATQLPQAAEAVLYELSLLNVTPVIAHPERNLVFAEKPEKLARLIDLGAIAQVTAGSIIGHFGKQTMAVTNELLTQNLVHLVASDAHSMDRRPPQLAEARNRIRQTWGDRIAATLFDANPAAVINNHPLPNQRSAINNQQSAISNQQSAIRDPQSAIRDPRSAIRDSQSAISNQQLAITGLEPATEHPVHPSRDASAQRRISGKPKSRSRKPKSDAP